MSGSTTKRRCTRHGGAYNEGGRWAQAFRSCASREPETQHSGSPRSLTRLWVDVERHGMSERQPYSRVYWAIRHDPKLQGIYSNDRHLATWLRLLIAADATWPAPADIPANARPPSVAALPTCGLVDLLGDGLCTIHGLDAERGRRREAASRGASSTPTGTQVGTNRDPSGDLARGGSRDELSRDELSR